MGVSLGDKVTMLKNGMKVKCDVCYEGYYMALSEDVKNCFYFKCDKCGETIIESRKLPHIV